MDKIIKEDMSFIYDSRSDWSVLKDKTVLVSGAYGMLPSYIVYFLIYLNETIPDMNLKIIVVVRDEKKLIARFGGYCKKTYFQTLISDIITPLELDAKIDYIIHGASPASSQYYGVDPVGVIKPNILGTYNLLEFARKNDIKNFLFFSTGEVYGSLLQDEIGENDFGAVNPMDIRSCYAESKRMGENLCKCYSHQYGLDIKVVRPAHTYGPTMDLKNDNRVFAEFVSNVVEGKDIIMKSDGSAERIFCYIADATVAFFIVMFQGKSGEAYNIANRFGKVSIKKLGEIIVNISKHSNLKVIVTKREKNLNYIENKHSRHSTLSTEKIERLGWKCKYSVEEGFERTINSFNKIK